MQYATGFHLGQVVPRSTQGASSSLKLITPMTKEQYVIGIAAQCLMFFKVLNKPMALLFVQKQVQLLHVQHVVVNLSFCVTIHNSVLMSDCSKIKQ